MYELVYYTSSRLHEKVKKKKKINNRMCILDTNIPPISLLLHNLALPCKLLFHNHTIISTAIAAPAKTRTRSYRVNMIRASCTNCTSSAAE